MKGARSPAHTSTLTIPLPAGIDVGFLLRKNADGKVKVRELGEKLGCSLYIDQEKQVVQVSNMRPKVFSRDAVVTALELVPFFVPIVEGPTVSTIVGSLGLLEERHGCTLRYNEKFRSITVIPREGVYGGRKELLEDLGATVSNSTSMTIEKGIDLFIDCRARSDDAVQFEPARDLDGFVHPKITIGQIGERDVGRYPSRMLEEFLQGGKVCKEGGRSKLQFRVGTLLLKHVSAVMEIQTVDQLQRLIDSQNVVNRRFVTGIDAPSHDCSILGPAQKESSYSVTLKRQQTQIRVTLVDLSETDKPGRDYLVPDLGNGLALKSCYEADVRLFSIECWNACGYDVRVQLQFDKHYAKEAIVEWAKLAKVVNGQLQLPPLDRTAFIWDRTRAKKRNRYIVGDVIYDFAEVLSTTRNGGSEHTIEVELSSRTFHAWARRLHTSGARDPLPGVDWDLLFDSAWHVSERIQEQKEFIRAQEERWWHCSPREEKLPETKTELLMPKAEDLQKVIRFYQLAPVEGKEPGDVRVIYNKSKAAAFRRKMLDLECRQGKAVFKPSWHTENQPEWRRQVFEQSLNATSEFADRDFPNVRLMPVWHGTKREAAEAIVNGGFAALQSTDEGWFGKGLYFAAEAKYSYSQYGKVLLLCWVGFFSAYPVIDGDKPKLQGKAAYKAYDAHFVPIGSDYNPLKANQKQMYTELVVFENMQCLPLYRVELRDCAVPMKPIAGFNVFVSEHGIDLVAAAKFCYSTYLSKSYTLGTIKYDWEFMSVVRPNHGLSHTLRTMAYVPFAVRAFKQHCKKPHFANSPALSSIGMLQLGMLFYVAGRENEAGSRDDLVAYRRFRQNSAAAFVHFVKVFKIPPTGFEKLVEQSILEGDFETSAVHCVMRIAHDVDCLRCQPLAIYDAICAPFHQYLSVAETTALRSLVCECTLATGDRIMGHDKLNRSYDVQQFVKCSKSVEICMSTINDAVSKSMIAK